MLSGVISYDACKRLKKEYGHTHTQFHTVNLFQIINTLKPVLKRNLKGPEHFSAEARCPFNQDILG
jgi:hypothetical protein